MYLHLTTCHKKYCKNNKHFRLNQMRFLFFQNALIVFPYSNILKNKALQTAISLRPAISMTNIPITAGNRIARFVTAIILWLCYFKVTSRNKRKQNTP